MKKLVIALIIMFLLTSSNALSEGVCATPTDLDYGHDQTIIAVQGESVDVEIPGDIETAIDPDTSG